MRTPVFTKRTCKGTSRKLARNAKNLQRTSEKFGQAITRDHRHHIAFFGAAATATKADLYNPGAAVCAPLGTFGYKHASYTCV